MPSCAQHVSGEADEAAFENQRKLVENWENKGPNSRAWSIYPTLRFGKVGSSGIISSRSSSQTLAGGDAAAVGSGNSTQFMSKDDLSRMRHEMREQCRQRQRDQARRRADMDAECPLFLSLRMRRMMEFALEQPPTQLDAVYCNILEDGASLQDDAAQAIAALICHHKFPPAYVQYFIQEIMQAREPLLARHLYGDLLERMRTELREDPPSGIDWMTQPEGDLPALVPAKLTLKVQSTSAGDKYGVAGVTNEEVVMHKKSDDRGPPRTWFGTDELEVDQDDCVFRRAIVADLPIAKQKEEICRHIRDHQVVLIQGETGCGKTTQVPQYILEMALSLKRESRRAVRIVVTQPRRIAAITVAKRVAAELGEEVGKGTVGYKIRGTTVASTRCQLLFCTTGVVLRRLANEGSKWMFSPKTVTHLLVDEVHERGVETDFMLTFLKEVQSLRPNLRVILMSATMDTEGFLKYFSTEKKIEKKDEDTTTAPSPDSTTTSVMIERPPMVVCRAFCHPVEMVYLEDINKRLDRDRPAEAKSPDELRRDHPDVSESDGIDYDLILQLMEECERSKDFAWTFSTGSMQKLPKDPHIGAVLIFMPGLGEITEMMSKLEEQSSYSSYWWVLPLHANLPPEEQQTCFETSLPYGKRRKIIVSTNVAETSVTVPDVTVVIDTCRERRTQVDRYSNTPMLREQWCALDSLKQRRGRAGRVQPGVCFRMLPKSYFDRLDKVTPPEMQRTPLENVYLQVCASGIDDVKGFLAKTPDPPDEVAVQFAEVALRDLGALDERSSDGLTPLGRHLAALPCHPRLGKILVLGCLLGVEGPVLSIAAAMSVRNPMLTTQDQNKRQAWQAARLELTDSIGTRSDHCVWAYIMQEWRFGEMKQRDFCRKYGLGYERMCALLLP